MEPQPGQGNGGRSLISRAVIAVTIASALSLWATAVSAETAKQAAAAKAAATKAAETTQTLNDIQEAQRALATSVAQLRDQLAELQRALNGERDEVRQNRDQLQAGLDQAKGMREEVRGLYVESSGLKGDIAQVGKQVEGLETSLGNFRLSAGIMVALIIVLQLVLVGLMFRGRG